MDCLKMKYLPIFLQNKINIYIFLAVLFLLSVLTACSEGADAVQCIDPAGCVQIPKGGVVKIGVIQDLSGGASEYGRVQLNALNLVMEERGSRIAGFPVQLVVTDEGCTEAGGKNAAVQIVSDPQIAAVFGTTCSGAAASAAKVLSENDYVMISGSNSAPSLTSVYGEKGDEWYNGYFRTTSNDSYRGTAAAEFALKDMDKKIAATIDDGDSYTAGAAEIFRQEFIAIGGTIALSATIDKGEENMKPVLQRILNSGAELVYMPLFSPEGLAIILEMKELPEFKNIVILTSNTVVSEMNYDIIRRSIDKIYFTRSYEAAGDAFSSLLDSYTNRYGVPGADTLATAYDAVHILFDAIEAVSIKQTDGSLLIPKSGLRTELFSLKNYQGVSGVLSCDQFGDMGVKSNRIMMLSREMSEPVEVYSFTL